MKLLSRSAIGVALVTVCASGAEFQFGALTLQAPQGFIVERVAGPPLVDRPIVADFDEEGRLYVADSSGSNDPVKKQLEDKPHRIVRLVDKNGDGIFDESTVFADRMMFPEGAMWLDGSLYVSAPPSIWKLTDTNGDGVADRREEWFDAKTLTGCANDLHGPYLGLDGWIYWCKGAFAEQTYERPNGKPWVTRAAHIFRRQPEGGIVEAVMTGGMDNPVDVAFTAEGERIFTTTFFQHPGGGRRDGLVHAIYGGVYGKNHDVLDGHKRTGDLMPVLTHLGPAAPAGLTRYESQVFGDEYQNNLFAALFNLQKVTRHVLEPNGATYRSKDSDFVSSSHHDFHPTDVIEDAEGSLLIIDTGGWYKICCPTSQLYKPDVLGAIYRVRRTDGLKIDDPRGLKIDWKGEAARWLGDSRPAVARRAVQTLRKQGAVAPLKPVVEAGSEAQKRNAVWTLAGIESAEARNLIRSALHDEHSSVRQAAAHGLAVNVSSEAASDLERTLRDENLQVRRAAAEALGRTGHASSVPFILSALAGSPPDRVLEHSFIYALIEMNAPEETARGLKSGNSATRRAALIALDQMEDGQLRAADVTGLLSSSDPVLKQTANWIVSHRREWAGDLAEVFKKRLDSSSMTAEEERELEQQLALFASHSAMQEMLAGAVLNDQLTSARRIGVLRSMRNARLKEAPASWGGAVAQLIAGPDPKMAAEAAETAASLNPKDASALKMAAANSAFPSDLRLRCMGALSAGQSLAGSDFDFALAALNQPFPESFFATSVLTKAKLSNEQLLTLCEWLTRVGPIELASLLAAFENPSSEEVGLRLADSLKNARGLAGLHADRARQTFAKYSPSVQERASEIYQLLSEDTAKQAARIEELLPTLKGGDVRRGQSIFKSEQAACSTCHAIGYLGGNIGPDLTKIGLTRSERDLLEAIVFPSASFVRSYEPFIVSTKDGEEHSGVLRSDGAEELVLATGPGVEAHIPRAEVVAMRPGKLSIMPQGLDQQLTRQELADLVAFLRATRW